MSKESLKMALDSQDFYELMQAYRHAPLTQLKQTIDAFEDVKAFIVAIGAQQAQPTPAAPAMQPLTVIDIKDDDTLRFVQRVLESNAPQADRDAAAQMVLDIRRRVRGIAAPGSADHG